MIEYNFVPANTLSEAINQFYNIIKMLRSPEGCPWDRVQTTKTATESLIDEAYEYLDAGSKFDISGQREEIGDIMINLLMDFYIHEEKGEFTPVEAINEVCEKLIRRHPHVFSDAKADNKEEVLDLWNKVKETTEGKKVTKETIFGHIPTTLPPLEKSYEIQKKLSKVGFDWSDYSGVIDKIYEELDEVKEAIVENDNTHIEEELGDLLFSVVNLARFFKVRPNVALDITNRKVTARFQKLFDLAENKGIPLDKDHVNEMNALWDYIKENE